MQNLLIEKAPKEKKPPRQKNNKQNPVFNPKKTYKNQT